jgi:hypothetical protein
MFHCSTIIIIFWGTRVWTEGLHFEPLYQPFIVMGFFEIGSHELFSQVGFEPWSSWSLSPDYRCEPPAPGSILYMYRKPINHSLTFVSSIYPPSSQVLVYVIPVLQFCLSLLIPKSMFRGALEVSPLWVYFALVGSAPFVTVCYPLPPPPQYSTAVNTYCYFLCLHRCNVFWYCKTPNLRSDLVFFSIAV